LERLGEIWIWSLEFVETSQKGKMLARTLETDKRTGDGKVEGRCRVAGMAGRSGDKQD